MLLRIVSILFPLFAITAIGFLVGRRAKPDLSHANKLNMDVFVPALVFGALANKSFHIMQFLPLVVIMVAFYFILLRPQQKRAKQHQEMVKNMRRGDSVVTSGGTSFSSCTLHRLSKDLRVGGASLCSSLRTRLIDSPE